jgi:hypothetical protein
MQLKKLTIKNRLVQNKESSQVEFKQSFSKNTKSYVKSVCAFANNKGGYIVFGVGDSPRSPIGLGKKYDIFNNYDSKDFATTIQNCLSINIDFELYSFEQTINTEKKVFGVLKISESSQKPVICKISDHDAKLREGAIYFRYNSKSEEIKAQDLVNLIQLEKDKEKEKFLDTIQKIAEIGVGKVGVFSYDGEIFAGERKVIIDEKIIKKLKFIKKGHFVEKDGAPALVLKGEIKDMKSAEVIGIQNDPNVTHPFEGISLVISEIQKRQNIPDKIFIDSKGKEYTLKYLCQVIKKNLEDDKSLCWKNKKETVKKYSELFIEKIISIILDQNQLKDLLN